MIACASEPAWSQETRRLFVDRFRDGIHIGALGSAEHAWFYFSADPFVGDDGVATVRRGRLHIEPPTQNTSREPVFTHTLGQEGGVDNPFGLPGGLDHVKWLVYQNHLALSGFAGYDIAPGREIVCSVSQFGGRTYGTAGHPFGTYVPNANDDLRLAAFAVNTTDFESFLVADFFLTNEHIYAVYERLPFGRTLDDNYAAFTFATPVASHHPDERHHLQIAWSQSYIRWIVNGREHFRVDRPGFRLDRALLTLDHGGIEPPEPVVPRQVDCGFGLFTLLDASWPGTMGLVQLSNVPGFYFDPDVGEPTLEHFVDETSALESRLFGQGASLDIQRYVILDRQQHLGPGNDDR
jgi:hypothetical protein